MSANAVFSASLTADASPKIAFILVSDAAYFVASASIRSTSVCTSALVVASTTSRTAMARS